MAIQLPLRDLHDRLGARFGEADGHAVPLHYGDPSAEYRAVRERVGILDRSHRGKVEASGRDRAAFLQGMLSNDVKALAPGQGCPAAFLDVHGKLIALLTVHCLADRLVLETDYLLVAPTLAALDRFLIMERVELEDASARQGILTLAGPDARKRVEEILEAALPDLARCHHVRGSLADLDVRIVRDDDTGEEGYDLWGEAAALRRVWERAVESGVQPVGWEAWEVLRVEAGLVRHGTDVDASTLIMEAPLDGAYSLQKGCYLGQEVIARVTYRGHVNRKIVGFVFPDERIPEAGAAVTVEGREVGRITSAVVSPALHRGVALGFLRREHWEAGTRVLTGAPGGPLSAEVATLPFYRRAPSAH